MTRISFQQTFENANFPIRTQTLDPMPTQARTIAITTTTQKATSQPQQFLEEDEDSEECPQAGIRDDGVSDEIWAQLQLDKQADTNAALQSDEQIREFEQAVKAVELQRETLRKAEEAN